MNDALKDNPENPGQELPNDPETPNDELGVEGEEVPDSVKESNRESAERAAHNQHEADLDKIRPGSTEYEASHPNSGTHTPSTDPKSV